MLSIPNNYYEQMLYSMLTGTLTGTTIATSEQPKTVTDVKRPEKPQEGHPRTTTSKHDRIPLRNCITNSFCQ